MGKKMLTGALAGALALALAAPAVATDGPDMMIAADGWSYDALFTVGESFGDYTPVGILDGIGAWDRGDTVQVLVAHELSAGVGEKYELANGAQLDGARVTSFTLDKATMEITGAELAYDTIYGRADDNDGSSPDNTVDGPEDLRFGSFSRFCSAQGYSAGEYGFVDDIFFAGEESGDGTEWALDVASGEIWAAPDLGMGSWENVTAIDTGNRNTVGLILGDDTAPAPLYLYLGRKKPRGDFLERNGLVGGQLYVYVAREGATPEEFNGTGSRTGGQFVRIDAAHPDGTYKLASELQAEAAAMGAFMFSRPEDVATSPLNGRRFALNSTGRGQLYPSDDWGTTYVGTVGRINGVRPRTVPAGLRILHDADDYGDYGIRSADNLDWADDGYLYVQEDRSVYNETFGEDSGHDASIWRVNPRTGAFTRIAEVDGTAVPVGQGDPSPELGNWETSGILDISGVLGVSGPVLVGTVQAHSVETFPADLIDVAQGGQLFILSED